MPRSNGNKQSGESVESVMKKKKKGYGGKDLHQSAGDTYPPREAALLEVILAHAQTCRRSVV